MGIILNRRRVMGGGREFDIVSIIPRTIPNTYIETDGTEKVYNGWCSTDFIPISFSFYMISSVNVARDFKYSAFYDINKNFIVGGSGAGYGVIPANVVYFRFSTRGNTSRNVYFSKNAISTGVYMEDAYIDSGSGNIVPYANWDVFKFDILDDVYVFSSTQNYYNASYYSDGSVLEYGKVFYHKPFGGYVLVSVQRTNSVFFVYGKHFSSIQQ